MRRAADAPARLSTGRPFGANVVRDIEYGREVTLANIEAVAAALGLKLEHVEQAG